MQIFVRAVSGDTMLLEACSVADLQHQVEERTSIPAREQRLLYGGKQLAVDRDLHEYDIQPHATLFLLVRMRGGVPWDRILMCVQACQLVWPKVREWVRVELWNPNVAEHNQCPPRCLKLCPEPESSEEEEPDEPSDGVALRGRTTIEEWGEVRSEMDEWLVQYSSDVEEGRVVEPARTAEQGRFERSVFSKIPQGTLSKLAP